MKLYQIEEQKITAKIKRGSLQARPQDLSRLVRRDPSTSMVCVGKNLKSSRKLRHIDSANHEAKQGITDRLCQLVLYSRMLEINVEAQNQEVNIL